ncbi:MAG: hypothetical protein H6601_06675 [Flavobacteriales bacterium]|nr:hypothetical protein [Flavobacteriales bacterium]
MAKQVGLLRYSGTMGGVSHFKMKGLDGDFARLAGGPSKEQIETAPEFARTRENMSEFGGSAANAKALRVGLASLLGTMGDPQLAGRLTKVFKEINLAGMGQRGQRPIELSNNGYKLEGFNFDRNIPFDSVFNAGYTISTAPTRESSDITVDPFNPIDLVHSPTGATHFRLINAIVVVSNYKYITTSNKYEPVDPINNSLSAVQYSNYLPVDIDIPVPTTLNATLPGAPVLGPEVSVVQCVGIEFYQEVSGSYYLLSSDNAMKVELTF